MYFKSTHHFWQRKISSAKNIRRHESNVSIDNHEVKKRLSHHPKVPEYATIVPTVLTKKKMFEWMRGFDMMDRHGPNLLYDFSDIKSSTMSERGALKEARRCLRCADPPCQKSCAAYVDIRAFIACIANKNYYGAAKIILSDSPFGPSCGMICPSTCAGSCNLAATEEGPIKIRGLEHFCTEVFSKMGVKQRKDPCTPKPKNPDKKISLIGSGPSGLTCATFLGRMGYTNVHVYELYDFIGGLCTQEIPHYRLPMDTVNFEISMVRDLGVHFHCNKPLKCGCVTVEELMEDSAAIYIAIGLPQPRLLPIFKGLTTEMGFYTSKSFMPAAALGSKWGLCGKKALAKKLPKLHGTVMILGGGDTAFHCATTALRCGAQKVFVAFRDEMCQLHAVPEEVAMAVEEKVELVAYSQPHELHLESGKICSITFARSFMTEDGKWDIDECQLTTMKTDFIITAYGSLLEDPEMMKALHPLKMKNGKPVVDPHTLQTSEPNVFAGGDFTGLSGTVVDAINDGKNVAWRINCLLEEKPLDSPSELPRFYTEIDAVDISIEVCGMKFDNPFGLAPGPSANSGTMIRRAFEEGWGFAVTKSFTFAGCEVSKFLTALRPRFERDPNQKVTFSVEGFSEKSMDYWCDAIAELKKDFPSKVLIASVGAGRVMNEWAVLAHMASDAGADALELNMSLVTGENAKDRSFDDQLLMIRKIIITIQESVKKPIFVKLPVLGAQMIEFVETAKKTGALGVTVMGPLRGQGVLHPEGAPKNADIDKNRASMDGMVTGVFVRQLNLAALTRLAKEYPSYTLLGVGGVDSAEAAMEYFRAGASLVQVGGAIQNQDYTIIDDFCTGLKALLYLSVRLPDWSGQSPPQFNQQKGKKVHTLKDENGNFLPHFGFYAKQRAKQMAQLHVNEEGELVSADYVPLPNPPPRQKGMEIPKLEDIVGCGLEQILPPNKVGERPQMVASVNHDICINCGRCYLACNDSGYQAISFDKKTHIPTITKSCVGCGMCRSTCPIIDCIKLIPLKSDEEEEEDNDEMKDAHEDEGGCKDEKTNAHKDEGGCKDEKKNAHKDQEGCKDEKKKAKKAEEGCKDEKKNAPKDQKGSKDQKKNAPKEQEDCKDEKKKADEGANNDCVIYDEPVY